MWTIWLPGTVKPCGLGVFMRRRFLTISTLLEGSGLFSSGSVKSCRSSELFRLSEPSSFCSAIWIRYINKWMPWKQNRNIRKIDNNKFWFAPDSLMLFKLELLTQIKNMREIDHIKYCLTVFLTHWYHISVIISKICAMSIIAIISRTAIQRITYTIITGIQIISIQIQWKVWYKTIALEIDGYADIWTDEQTRWFQWQNKKIYLCIEQLLDETNTM